MTEKIIPNKRLGQNFLINKYTINTLLEIIDISKNDLIIEIGPGQGALTKEILKKTNNYIGIEKDKKLCKVLEKISAKKLNIRNEDVLKTDFSKIYKEKYRIVGNIPYNISTKLLLKCIENKDNIINIHFMMQKEFVDRIISNCGNKTYGRLSVLMQLFFVCEKFIDINPADFYPSPKVYSSFLKLTPRKENLLNKKEIDGFLSFTKSIFSKRRKKIKNSLDIECFDLYDNMDKRAEQLTINEMIKLFRDINKR